MKPYAILYTSNTGHTCQYAHLLGDRLGLSVYSLPDANKQLPKGSPVIYLGWLHASHVKGYSKAAKRFALCAVCGVGLCDTGTLTDQVRKATSIPVDIPLFTLQGGIDRGRLKGMDIVIREELRIRKALKPLPLKKHQTDMFPHTPMYHLFNKLGFVEQNSTFNYEAPTIPEGAFDHIQ